MAYITCPCGFRVDTNDDAFETLSDWRAAFDAHGCDRHPPKLVAPESPHSAWANVIGFIALLACLVIVCSLCSAVMAK